MTIKLCSRFSCAGTVLAFLLLATSPARAGLGGNFKLDESFCNNSAFRETVVYLDDTMRPGKPDDLGNSVATKLKASLLPGETVAVVRLSLSKGGSEEVWKGCWPNYSQEEIQKQTTQWNPFSQGVGDRLKEQQTLFFHYMKTAISKVYASGDTASKADQTNGHPKKQILRALASDDARYAGNRGTVRGIIYSDMMENSDLLSIFSPSTPLPNFSTKLGSRFSNSVFYVFGISDGGSDTSSFQETARKTWGELLDQMGAVVSGFGSVINVPNIIPTANRSYTFSCNLSGEALDGKLVLLTDANDALVDSRIIIPRMRGSVLTGTFVCKQDRCKLTAETLQSILTVDPSVKNSLVLSGSVDKLTGDLSIPNDSNKTKCSVTADIANVR